MAPSISISPSVTSGRSKGAHLFASVPHASRSVHIVRALGGRLLPAPALRPWQPFPMRLGSCFACGAFPFLGTSFSVPHGLWSRLDCIAHHILSTPPPSPSNRRSCGYRTPSIGASWIDQFLRLALIHPH